VVVVVALVAVPILRALSVERRSQLMILTIVAVWLTVFGWLEDWLNVTSGFFTALRWDDALIDLVRWVGWIPLAIWLQHRLCERHAAKARGA